MSQAYIHACERAELLGMPIPSEEEWQQVEKIKAEADTHDDEDDAIIQNLDSSNEATQRIGGGLDELNSILSATQKKINRFKTVCGSLGTLLRVKVDSKNNTSGPKIPEQDLNQTKMNNPVGDEETLETDSCNDDKHDENTEANATVPKKIDINEKMGSHLGKLDSLITKAENAQYSMQHQTKQMKKFLK